MSSPPGIPRDLLVKRLEQRLTPVLGELMAKASIRAQLNKLEVDDETLSPREVEALLDALAKGMRVFVGSRRTQTVTDSLREILFSEVER